jgi:hypothetical protein
MRFLAYAEWGSAGLTALGTWIAPSVGVQQFGPGIDPPGAVVQQASNYNATTFNLPVTNMASVGLQVSLSPKSAANFINILAVGGLRATYGVMSIADIAKGTSRIGNGMACAYPGGPSGADMYWPSSMQAWDFPNSTASQAYYVGGFQTSSGSGQWNPVGGNCCISAQEIQA